MDLTFGTGRPNLTGPIIDGVCIRQAFKAMSPELKSVEIAFATYCRKNDGEMTVAVHDPRDNSLVGKAKAYVCDYEDNAYHKFDLNVELVQNRPYELRIYTLDCRNGSSVTAKYCQKTNHENHLFIGARIIKDGELSAIFHYDTVDMHKEETSDANIAFEYYSVLPKHEETMLGLVSVIVPHYNCQKLLKKCLASLTRQTYNAIEVIVVDDGSLEPGRTQLTADSFDGMLKVSFVHHKDNRGAPAARNTGLKYARGQYLLFLDADCELYPDALQVFVESLLENPDASWAYGGFRWGHEHVAPKAWNPDGLIGRNYITTMSMIRRSDFPACGWDEELKRHQDWDLWLTMVKEGKSAVCTEKYMFETPQRPGSISTDGNIEMMASVRLVREKHGL